MSQSIAFIGVGNMGCPMAENLMKAGKFIKVFDVSKKMLEIAKIAKSLGMVIHYHNRSKLSEDKEQGATYHDSIKSLF